MKTVLLVDDEPGVLFTLSELVTERGHDMQYSLTVSFIDAATGTTRRLSLPDGKTLDVRIPPGTEDGHVLRLRGQGGPGYNGAAAGDALIEVTVAPDPRFHRDGC